ncbi:hypothetical protein [Bifidobacterium aquikefiricola]|uniref:Uncharacterized protein n=1 Tax=Bifidobacterium aquikefiricola TaxID=3059038 RepID=A0AB39U6S1_9BIFI
MLVVADHVQHKPATLDEAKHCFQQKRKRSDEWWATNRYEVSHRCNTRDTEGLVREGLFLTTRRFVTYTIESDPFASQDAVIAFVFISIDFSRYQRVGMDMKYSFQTVLNGFQRSQNY